MTKNKNYRDFLDTGMISLITESQLVTALNNIKSRYKNEARALLICLYFTGCRPAELFLLKGKDFSKEKSYLVIQIPTLKHGRTRLVWLKFSNLLVKELWKYKQSMFLELPLFFHFKGNYQRQYIDKKGGVRVYNTTSDRLRYYIYKWFGGVVDESIPPYFLRHNRFSQLARAGASDRMIKQMKGSVTYASIEPYIHQTSESGKKSAKLIK